MRKLKRYSVPANSMAESVIAMAIIAVCLAVGSMTFTSVTSSSGGLALLNGRAALDRWAFETQNNRAYSNASIAVDGCRIQRTITREGVLQNITFTLTCGAIKEQKSFIIYEE